MTPSKQLRHTLPFEEAVAAERMGFLQKSAYHWCYTQATDFEPLRSEVVHHDSLKYHPHALRVCAFSAAELESFLPPGLCVVWRPGFCGWVACRETYDTVSGAGAGHLVLEPVEKKGYANKAVALLNALRQHWGENTPAITGLNALYERALAGGDYLV